MLRIIFAPCRTPRSPCSLGRLHGSTNARLTSAFGSGPTPHVHDAEADRTAPPLFDPGSRAELRRLARNVGAADEPSEHSKRRKHLNMLIF